MNFGGKGVTAIGSRHRQTSSNVDSGASALVAELQGLPLSPAQRTELESLRTEADPQLFQQQLLNFGVRAEQEDRLDLAARVYALSGPQGQVRLDALLGKGALGARAEFLLRRLTRETLDPSTLIAMGAAGAAFRLTRWVGLSRLLTAEAGILTRGFGARATASLAAFAVEAPVFTLSAKSAREVLGQPQDWSRGTLRRDLASGFLLLGGLKLAGWATGAGLRAAAVGEPGLAGLPLRGILHQAGTLTGILLGHRAEELFGLREAQDGATTLIDSLALLLQFHAAGNFSRAAFGKGFAAWEQGLDLAADRLAQSPPALRPPPAMAMATASGPAGGPEGRNSVLAPIQIMQMTGEPKTPTDPAFADTEVHSPILRARPGSEPPSDQGILGKDAVRWGAAKSRDPEDVRLVAQLATKIRSAMWDALNLHIEGPVARALARRQTIEAKLIPIDGSMDHYSVELSADTKAPQIEANEVRFLVHTEDGSLRLKDYLPNARWEIRQQERDTPPLRGFIPFYRSILGFRSEGLQSRPLVDTLPPDAREYVLMDPTQKPESGHNPISEVRAAKDKVLADAPAPSILMRYFPRVAAGVRKATEDYLDFMMIQGPKERQRLHRLMQNILLKLRQREMEEPKLRAQATFQVWIRPSAQGGSRRSLELLTPVEAVLKNQQEPYGENDILLLLMRYPSTIGGNDPILEHQYLRLNPKNPDYPAGADLEFQRDLGLGDQLQFKIQLNDLRPYPPDFHKWDKWMEDNGFSKDSEPPPGAPR